MENKSPNRANWIVGTAVASILLVWGGYALGDDASHHVTNQSSSVETSDSSADNLTAEDAPGDSETAAASIPPEDARMIEYGAMVASAYGLTVTPEEWLAVRDKNCAVDTPGTAKWWVPSDSGATEANERDVFMATLAASFSSTCIIGRTYVSASSSSPALTTWMTTFTFKKIGVSPPNDSTTDGNGYYVTCNDGWTSGSGGIQGACSHHGGVSG